MIRPHNFSALHPTTTLSLYLYIKENMASMLYSEKDLRSVTTSKNKFTNFTNKTSVRYRVATFASGNNSFKMKVDSEFCKVFPLKKTHEAFQGSYLVLLKLDHQTNYPFMIIKDALMKELKCKIKYCYKDTAFLITNKCTLLGLKEALAKPYAAQLILTIKLKHIIFRANTLPRINYTLEHIEEVVAGTGETE